MSELDRIKALKAKVKHGKLKIERKSIKAQLLKGIKKTDHEREEICKNARKDAHTPIANMRRDMSNQVRSGLGNTLSEGYDFIEESYGSGQPEFTFYDKPQISESISEAFADGNPFKMIGVAEGVFAPIGVMSRNNRMYDNDHYDYLLENQNLVDKIASRGMLGTIGHHDKRVDDDDLAEEKVSHIVTDLHIQEEADGTRNLIGRLEILDTKAGRALKTYYDSGMPLYVSSRGAGRLLPVANESYKRVDKTNYYLETFDVVRDPGFLGAKPKYLKESLDENIINGDNDMGQEKVTPAISTDMETEEIVSKMLNPLQEQLAELADAVKMLAEKVLEEEKVEEAVETTEEATKEVSEECAACEEPKQEIEDDEHEEAAPVAPEVLEGAKEEAVVEAKEDEAEDAEEDEAKAEELKADAEEDREDAEEIKEEVSEECDKKEDEEETKEETKEEKIEESTEEVSEEKKDEEAEKLDADAEEDEAKAEKLEKDAKEDEAEKVEEAVEEVKEEKIEESTEEVSEECDKEECHKDEEEKCEDCKEEEDKEEVEEAIDYKAEYEKNDAVAKDLLKLVEEATSKSKAVLEKYNNVVAELNAYKLSEEFSITIDEAKAKLAESSIEAIREELTKVEETPIEKEPEDAEEEKVAPTAPVTESKKAVTPVWSCFPSISESKSKKGVFSVFKNI